jgi:primosomal protein N' (replication factor Y)
MNLLVQVAVPSPLYGVFDYRWASSAPILPGARVRVPFGRRQVTGIVMGPIADSAVPEAKLRSVAKVHDAEPVLSADILQLLQWASRYYHHPIGEVLTAALPVLLRKGKPADITEREFYRWVPSDEVVALPRAAAVQQQLLDYLRELAGKPVASDVLAQISPRWRASLKPLVAKGWVVCDLAIQVPQNKALNEGPELFDEQREAVSAIQSKLGSFQPFLLKGVTGSGKTEVYLRCIQAAIAQGLQALI